MDEKKKLVYYGELKVTDGKYQDKEGKEKTRYVALGKLFHSPHFSRVSIYLYPTALSEGRWINAYPHDEYEKPLDEVTDVSVNEQINTSDIPF